MNKSHQQPVADADAAVQNITILTLNAWALKHISHHILPRVTAIAHNITSLKPSIVCLQELFTQDAYSLLRRLTAQTHPYGKYFHSGPLGASGLVILSRWPIEEASLYPYALNGRPTAFWRGDWYVGKGVAWARVRFGPGERDVVDVFNTHTHSPYEANRPFDTYLVHRLSQFWQLSKLLRSAARGGGGLVVAAGDFNMLPLSTFHRIVTARSGSLRDAWRMLHPDSSLGPVWNPSERARGLDVPSAAYNLAVNGATSNTAGNTWRFDAARQKRIKRGDPCHTNDEDPDPRGQRLDYIFVSTGQQPRHDASSLGDTREGWVVSHAEVAMTHRHPDLHVSLSDHFAVLVTLEYHRSASPADADPAAHHHHPSSPEAQLAWPGEEDLPTHAYDDILEAIRAYTAREQAQRRWRAVHFYAGVVVWAACLVAVWFSPGNYVAFLLVLVGSLGLATGVVDGLLSLLFFTSEIGAIREFEWEVRNARALAAGDFDAMAKSDGINGAPDVGMKKMS